MIASDDTIGDARALAVEDEPRAAISGQAAHQK